jgi:metacaspase-1
LRREEVIVAKRALLIGVNKYQMAGADLRGCVNDVVNLKSVLQDLYGFKPRDIAVLTDGKATQKAMADGITGLLRGAKPGDVLVLHFSGHGSNVPDADGDEADGRDEILCPTDLDWKRPFTDDWLRRTFDRHLQPGVSLTAIMDCCHSGTITRAVAPPDATIVQRYLPSPWDLVAEESGRNLRGKVQTSLRKSRSASRRLSDIVNADLPEVLITGCRDTQTSADAFLGGAFNGALTYSLMAAIRESGGRLTYRQLHERALKQLRKGRFDQVPQLEGRKARFDQPLFSPITA